MNVGTDAAGAAATQVVELRLEHPRDMFEMPQSDLFTEYRNFLTGVDYCISELRSRKSRRPVRIDISLPLDAIDEGLDERMARTLRRYCDHRIAYNGRERRALRFDGITALRIGLPVTVVGLVLTVAAASMDTADEAVQVVLDHLGWVFAWIGLWFPLDTLLFFGHQYSRESGVLAVLRDADIVIHPYERS